MSVADGPRRRAPRAPPVFTFVVEGEASIGDGTVTAGQLAWLSRDGGENNSTVTIAAGRNMARLFLSAGHALREPGAFGGPFVTNTEAEIKEAHADYRTGRF